MNVCDGYGVFTREEIHGGEWCEVVAGECGGCSACMRMLSGHQPWPTFIGLGVKRIETRGWSTGFRGPIAIHAALKWPGMMTIPPLKRDGIPPERDAHNHVTWQVLTTITDPAFHGPLPCNPKTGRQRRVPKAAKSPTLFWPHGGPWHEPNPEKPQFPRTEVLPLGAVVAVADLVDVLPIISMDGSKPRPRSFIADLPSDGPLPHQRGGLWIIGDNAVTHGVPTRIEDQAPFGDFTPGRYGWLLENVRRLPKPVPAKGFQGLRACPQDVAEKIAEQLA